MASEFDFPDIDPNGSTFSHISVSNPYGLFVENYEYGLTVVGTSLTDQKLVFDGLNSTPEIDDFM